MRRVVLVGFALTVALAPLPLGSNRDWSWGPLAFVIGMLLLVWTVMLVGRPAATHRPLVLSRSMLIPSVLFAVVVVWGLLQLSGWTPESWATPFSSADVFGPKAANRSVAFNVEQAVTGIMRLLTYAGVFLLAASLSETTRDSRSILGWIVLGGVLYTLYAMVADVANRQASTTGWAIWVPHAPFFTGTFINGNTYATYAGVTALAALALAARRSYPSEREESARQRWRRRIGEFSGSGGLWFAASIVLMGGMLLSGSRGGWASLACSVGVMALLHARSFGRVIFAVLTPLVFALVAIVLPEGDRLVNRTVQLISEGEPGREALFPLTMNAIGLRPLVGWGMNSFDSAYSVFQPASSGEYYDKAHNTYLELAFDYGIPVASLLVLAVIWLAARCLIGFFTRRRDRELAGLGFFASVLVGIHSMVDFSLQIPGMACTYFAILGIAWAQSWSSRHTDG